MTNTEYLMSALGWKVGDIHHIAIATGLTVSEILDLNSITAQHNQAYQNGFQAVKLHVIAATAGDWKNHYKPRSDLFRAHLVSFWRGVLDAKRFQ